MVLYVELLFRGPVVIRTTVLGFFPSAVRPRAVEVSLWAMRVFAVVTCFVTVEAFEVRAVADACDRMFSIALLVMRVRVVGSSANVTFNRVSA